MSRIKVVPAANKVVKPLETDEYPFTEQFSCRDRPRPLVLVVDAHRESRADLECKLKRYSYRVVGVESASTAIELMEQQRFDVCLLDMNFAEMDA
ncbi:Signal transduction response regulator, receiver region domain protein, partial [Rhodopirellula maiorica SM1]